MNRRRPVYHIILLSVEESSDKERDVEEDEHKFSDIPYNSILGQNESILSTSFLT